MTGTVAQSNWKKFFMQLLAGAVVGGASAAAVMSTYDDLGSTDPSQLFAVMTGLIYALMGLMVGIGAISPSAGARFLNVDDAEELRDQRIILGLSSVACLLIGLLFLTLAVVPAGGTGGLISRDVAAALSGICLVALIVLTRLTNRRVDELAHRISMEASTLAMQASFVVFGGWAALAHLGFVDWVRPLSLVSGMAFLMLLAIFWVSAKRGLMVPRKIAPPRSN